MMYFKADDREAVFPLNAKDPNEDDWKCTSELCQSMLSIQKDLLENNKLFKMLVFH